MGSYLANFTVYAMAMTGLIFFAVFIYKKSDERWISLKQIKFPQY